ncbi:MAG: hypothetical protein AAF515_14350 [Pseudomonadota bacterium]
MTVLSIAALLLAVSGVLHFVGPLLAGFASASLPLLVFGVLYLILAHFLRRGSRLVAWIVFFMMLVFGIGALGQTGGVSPVPDWVTYAIIAADLACAACLFVVLWRDPAPTT